MIEHIYLYINLLINAYILIAVYYFCIKRYGIKATIIANMSLSSLVLILIFTGSYSVAELEIHFPQMLLKVGETEFLATDPITIFTVFIVIFELARYSLKLTNSSDLTLKNIMVVSLLTSIYGICLQLLMDPTTAVMGLYYYQILPPINIFGFPIWFITSFRVYGLYSFTFLMFEWMYYIRKIKLERML